MYILGIESSCDETSAAVLKDGKDVLSNVISSQVPLHQIYGGVVPEIASRAHLEAINGIVQKALDQAKIEFKNLNAISVTNRPGLIGSLLVGVSAAKAYAYALNIPLIPVNHLEAHLMAGFFEKSHTGKVLEFPFLGLLVSGGHTALYEVTSPTSFQVLGKTLDDAVGECLDKGGKLLDLPYPGGVFIDRIQKGGDSKYFEFPRAMLHSKDLKMSFSGVKTSLFNWVQNQKQKSNWPLDEQIKKNIAASYLEAVVDALCIKTMAAMDAQKKTNCHRLVVAGGVAANSVLRDRLLNLSVERGFELWIPKREFCTDNAAMVALQGHFLLQTQNPKQTQFDLELLSMTAFSNG